MRAIRVTIAITAVAIASSLIAAAPAGAHTTTGKATPTPTVLTTAVGAPFNLDVSHGKVLVADGGAGLIGKVKADGTVKTLVSGATGTSGLAFARGGRYFAYTTTEGGPPAGPITKSGVTITGPRGFSRFVNTLTYEQAKNPDGVNTYGLADPSQCTADPGNPEAPPLSYTGAIDSHAYSLLGYGKGFILADAGANALLRISSSGRVSTLAVLPAQPAVVSKEVAAQFGLICTGDVTYNFEPVPTDVEVGRDGFLYVTTLAGGPEDPSLGARSKVYRVNPRNGHLKEVASGLLGATNLAISKGLLYVTEAYAGRVSVIRHGAPAEFLALPGALSIEAGRDGRLYVGTGIFGPGSVVRIDKHVKGWRH